MQAYEPYSSLVARYEALYRGCKPKGPGNGKGRSAGTWDATALEALCERLQMLALDEYRRCMWARRQHLHATAQHSRVYDGTDAVK